MKKLTTGHSAVSVRRLATNETLSHMHTHVTQKGKNNPPPKKSLSLLREGKVRLRAEGLGEPKQTSSGLDRTTALMSSQQLQLPAQDLDENQVSQHLAWRGREAHEPPPN